MKRDKLMIIAVIILVVAAGILLFLDIKKEDTTVNEETTTTTEPTNDTSEEETTIIEGVPNYSDKTYGTTETEKGEVDEEVEVTYYPASSDTINVGEKDAILSLIESETIVDSETNEEYFNFSALTKESITKAIQSDTSRTYVIKEVSVEEFKKIFGDEEDVQVISNSVYLGSMCSVDKDTAQVCFVYLKK